MTSPAVSLRAARATSSQPYGLAKPERPEGETYLLKGVDSVVDEAGSLGVTIECTVAGTREAPKVTVFAVD